MLAKGIEAIREHLAGLPASTGVPVADLRAAYDKAEKAFPLPDSVRVESVEAGGVPSERLIPEVTTAQRTLLYFHGGGYVLGSPSSHRHMVAAIAVAARAEALLIHYRRAPESPFPAAVEDAVAAYQSLLNNGTSAQQIALAGDSAGGGLTVATLLALKQRAIPLPACAICISPWADLSNCAESYQRLADADPMVTIESIKRWTDAYLAGTDPDTPLASPVRGDLAELPPVLIQVGSDEVLLDDSKALAEGIQIASGEVELEIWPGMIHVWHWFGDYLDEAQAATAKIGQFINQHT